MIHRDLVLLSLTVHPKSVGGICEVLHLKPRGEKAEQILEELIGAQVSGEALLLPASGSWKLTATGRQRVAMSPLLGQLHRLLRGAFALSTLGPRSD